MEKARQRNKFRSTKGNGMNSVLRRSRPVGNVHPELAHLAIEIRAMQPQPLGGPTHVAAKLLDRAANVLDLKTGRRVGQGPAQIVDQRQRARAARE